MCDVKFGTLILMLLWALSSGVNISNLSEQCLRCLCHVAGCNTSHTCSGGYCGPFYISRLYWKDAGRPTLPDDDPERPEVFYLPNWSCDCVMGAYSDCARDYHCSIRIVTAYLARYGKDCNGDGVTNCFDYMMINHNGGAACGESLQRSVVGRRQLGLFKQCKFN